MQIPFNPWFGRVLLKRERMKKTTGGIILPEESQRRHSRARGEIVAVGDQCSEVTKKAVGKTVLFGVHAGAWLDGNGVESDDDNADYFLCSEDDILGDVND